MLKLQQFCYSLGRHTQLRNQAAKPDTISLRKNAEAEPPSRATTKNKIDIDQVPEGLLLLLFVFVMSALSALPCRGLIRQHAGRRRWLEALALLHRMPCEALRPNQIARNIVAAVQTTWALSLRMWLQRVEKEYNI